MQDFKPVSRGIVEFTFFVQPAKMSDGNRGFTSELAKVCQSIQSDLRPQRTTTSALRGSFSPERA